MKETPLHKAFDDATRKIAQDPHRQNVARQLEILRDIALEFHDADVPVTLETRPEKYGLPDDDRDDVDADDVLANGVITIGRAKLDFVIEKNDYDDNEMTLKIFRDKDLLLRQISDYDEDEKTWTDRIEDDDDDEDYGDGPNDWDLYPDEGEDTSARQEKPEPAPKNLKAIVTGLLIKLKAEDDFVGRYNVGPNGVPGVIVEKPFPVAAPVKLKKPGKP